MKLQNKAHMYVPSMYYIVVLTPIDLDLDLKSKKVLVLWTIIPAHNY